MSSRMTTEMEVEVDMAAPLSFYGHADDEDLIDYDIDTTEQHQHQTFLSPPAEGSYPDAQTDVSMELHTKLGDQVSEGGEPRTTDDGDLHDDMHLDEIVRLEEDTVNEQNSLHDPFAEGAGVGDESKDGAADTAEVATLEAHETDNEIDYEEFEHDDASTTGKSYEGHRSFEEAAQHPEYQHSDNLTESDPTKPTDETHLVTLDQQRPEIKAEAEKDEINWEQENAQTEQSPPHEETSSQPGQEYADESAQENEDNESEPRSDQEDIRDDEFERPLYEEQKNGIEINHDQLKDVVELEEANLKPDPETAHDSSFEEHENFPQITVQYKGDEFPFFSLEASEGFFSDHLVLDYGMESLLAGLRAELSNEITTGEELVFQVDELGLEFAESHLQDSLSSITLRQILEIFDVLVKNQDPNSTRTLYTYLLTKPCTSKRYEFLLESAAAGKGLDEVVHLFQPSVSHNAAFVDLAQIADSVDDHIDSYRSSPPEIDGTIEAISESEVHGAHQENEEDEGEDEDEDEGEGENWTEDVQYIVGDHEELVDDGSTDEEEGVREDAEEDEGKAEEVAGEETAEEAGDDAEEKPAEEAEEVEEPASQDAFAASAFDVSSRQTISQIFDEPVISADMNGKVTIAHAFLQDNSPLNHTQSRHIRDVSDFSTTFSIADADELIPDYPEHQSNPLFIHDRIDDDPGDANDSEYAGQELHLADEQSENEACHPSVTNTASTNTIADELDTASNLARIEAEELLDSEALEDVLIDTDSLDEIDWRDDSDLVDAAGSEILASATKRARPDDEVGVEEGQDVKRRRS